MKDFQKIKSIAQISLLIINSAVIILILLYLIFPRAEANKLIDFDDAKFGKYVLFIGTNDKDTYDQIIPTDEAINIVNEICSRYTGGWTSSMARGGWLDETNTLTQETTLVYHFIYTDEDAIISIMDEVLTALNQNSILIERQDVSSAFYNGKK